MWIGGARLDEEQEAKVNKSVEEQEAIEARAEKEKEASMP